MDMDVAHMSHTWMFQCFYQWKIEVFVEKMYYQAKKSII
jgi:hypothetical protein